MNVEKRSGAIGLFDLNKIQRAIEKSFKETGEGTELIAKEVALKVKEKLQGGTPHVEHIQDCVERSLMECGLYDSAKAYILYRKERERSRQRDLFKKRINLKPYEYPELYEYVSAIRHSYWIHTEFNFTSDVHDFHVNVSPEEREAIKRAMLAIAQIEVAVKSFWGNIYKKIPKPEVAAVGATFAESEVRHTDAYAHLLEILGLNKEFENIREIPVLNKRYQYLENVVELSSTEDKKEYAKALLLFSLFIEHVSLFSQFLVMMSFNKHKNLFKGISNAVEATSKEEQIHGLFGIDLINLIQKENPDWFGEDVKEELVRFCRDSYQAEEAVIDWIFEKGELEFLPKKQVKEFVKHRMNNSLDSIGLPRPLDVDEKELEATDWFDNEVIATKHVDFFNKRSINYNKRATSVTGNDLF